jgi:hypothetical protein
LEASGFGCSWCDASRVEVGLPLRDLKRFSRAA